MRRTSDRGYALVAAVMAVSAFAYIALQVLAANEGEIRLETGRDREARLSAAADAGLNLAVHGLAADNQGARWPIDGRTHRLDFDGVELAVTVEDERGKASLSGLSDAQARALFEGAGASGDGLDALVKEFLAYQTDPNNDPDSVLESAPDFPMRHAAFRTVGELMALPHMNRTIYDRVAPVTTTFFEESGAFDPTDAKPLAAEAMKADAMPDADQADAEPDADSEQPVEEIADDRYFGRTLTIRCVARGADGTHAERMEIIELTGGDAPGYWVRYVE